MPLVIFEGPEAAGKTTLIEALQKRWGSNTQFRGWGPRESWLEYCQPLFDDIKTCSEDPNLLIIWSRSWLSRAVYNELLTQGHYVPKAIIRELDRTVRHANGCMFLVVSPITTLYTRRLERMNDPNSKPDHPLDPEKELAEFYKQNTSRLWNIIPGDKDTDHTISSVMEQIVRRNPDCRMEDAYRSITGNVPIL